MGRYIIRRLLQAIPLLFLISIIVFVLIMNMGDPLVSFAGRNGQVKGKDRERLIRQLGLDQPLYMQYIVWLIGNDWMKIDVNGDGTPDTPGERRGVLRGDLGTSVVTKQPVLKMIGDRLPNTLLLMFTAEIVIIVFALLLGILSAVGQYSWYDNLFTGLSFVGFSMPVPLLALGLIYIFGVYLKRAGLPYFPTVGMFEPSWARRPNKCFGTWRCRLRPCPSFRLRRTVVSSVRICSKFRAKTICAPRAPKVCRNA